MNRPSKSNSMVPLGEMFRLMLGTSFGVYGGTEGRIFSASAVGP